MKFKVSGKTYEWVEADDLEFNEVELLEDVFELPAPEVFALVERGSMKATKYLVFFAMRRKDSTVTLDDVGRLAIGPVAEAISAGRQAEDEAEKEKEKEKEKGGRPTRRSAAKAAAEPQEG